MTISQSFTTQRLSTSSSQVAEWNAGCPKRSLLCPFESGPDYSWFSIDILNGIDDNLERQVIWSGGGMVDAKITSG